MQEMLEEVFSRSKLLILDFNEIPKDTPKTEDISQYFESCKQARIDPKLPEHRQLFNDTLLNTSGVRYLVSRYGEERVAMLAESQIAREGRTLHLGVDIFCRDLENVLAPCDGDIVRIGNEPENHSFGHYVFFRPKNKSLPAILLGHLGDGLQKLGSVIAGDVIAKLGDYINHENGGWSRHLHVQMFRDIPSESDPLTGYSTREDFTANSSAYPDPLVYFPDWKIQGL